MPRSVVMPGRAPFLGAWSVVVAAGRYVRMAVHRSKTRSPGIPAAERSERVRPFDDFRAAPASTPAARSANHTLASKPPTFVTEPEFGRFRTVPCLSVVDRAELQRHQARHVVHGGSQYPATDHKAWINDGCASPRWTPRPKLDPPASRAGASVGSPPNNAPRAQRQHADTAASPSIYGYGAHRASRKLTAEYD